METLLLTKHQWQLTFICQMTIEWLKCEQENPYKCTVFNLFPLGG